MVCSPLRHLLEVRQAQVRDRPGVPLSQVEADCAHGPATAPAVGAAGLALGVGVGRCASVPPAPAPRPILPPTHAQVRVAVHGPRARSGAECPAGGLAGLEGAQRPSGAGQALRTRPTAPHGSGRAPAGADAPCSPRGYRPRTPA
jgi:hypothetical protein